MADESEFIQDPYNFSFEIEDESSSRSLEALSLADHETWGQNRSTPAAGDDRNVTNNEIPAEGYAEFFRLIARHKIPIFSPMRGDLYLIRARSTLGKGGTYIVYSGELGKPIAPEQEGLASGLLPLLSKCHDNVTQFLHPVEVEQVKKGKVVVSKHINVEGRSTLPEPAHYLPSLIREAIVLAHPTIRGHMGLPSLFGFAIEALLADSTGGSQQFPVMLMEMGSGGNLEEWFRGMWRANLSQRQRGVQMGRQHLQFTGMTEFKLVFSWKRKMRMASQLASALAALHEAGVVHGDVKAVNVICCPLHPEDQRPHSEIFLQLCDLGSCIVLSEIPSDTKSTLLSHSPPWNAPESTSRLDRTGLIKTDIYSFGLLLARILLNGNHPFDDDFHIISGKGAAPDALEISSLQKNDLVVEHLISRILQPSDLPTLVEDETVRGKFVSVRRDERGSDFDGCAFTKAQREIVKILIGATLKTSPSERLSDMRLMTEFLDQAHTDNDKDLEKYADARSIEQLFTNMVRRLVQSDLLAVKQEDVDIRFEQPNLSWVSKHSIIIGTGSVSTATSTLEIAESSRTPAPESQDFDTSDCAPQRQYFHDRASARYADEKRGIPNLLDPGFRYLFKSGSLTIHLAKDLKEQADNGSAEAALQVAWCYLHGWGSERSRDSFHRYFRQAIQGRSLSALENLQMISACEGQDILLPNTVEKEEILQQSTEAMFKAFARHPNVSLAAFLQRLEPKRFAETIHSLRINPQRFRTIDASARSGAKTDFRARQLQLASRVGDYDRWTSLLREANEVCESPLDLSLSLLEACSRGHAFMALSILQAGASPSVRDASGRTPLHFLARFDEDMVQTVGCVLLDEGASLSVADDGGLTPLAFALDGDNNFLPSSVYAAAEFLANNGATIGGPDANTPFTKALLTGNTRLVQLLETLLDSCGEKESKNDSYSLYTVGAAILEALKEPEALRLRKRGAWQCHALPVSTSSYSPAEQTDLLETILRLGRKLEPLFWGNAVAVHRALDVARLIKSLPEWSPTYPNPPPTFMLNQIGDLDMMREILRLGIKFDHTHASLGSVNIFHLAAMFGWPVSLLEVLCREQKEAVNLKDMVNGRDPLNCLNPFDLAVLGSHLPLADFFRDLGADTTSAHIILSVEASLKYDPHEILPWAPQTPVTILGALIYAHRAGGDPHLSATRYILRMGPSAMICPESKMNVFHALWPRWREVPKTNIQPESSDPYDNTNQLFELLLRNFSDKRLINNADDWNGGTPLHYAAVSGNVKGVRRLLDLGAEINTKNVTPEELAMRNFICETGFKSHVESGHLVSPVIQFTVIDPLLYILFEMHQLLFAARLLKEGILSPDDLKGSYMNILRISVDIAHNPRSSDVWMNRITQYTLVQFLPPSARQDLPSFDIEFVPPGWWDTIIKPLPNVLHKFALNFIHITRKSELCRRYHDCFNESYSRQHVGWLDSENCLFDCGILDEQPDISALSRSQDAAGRMWVKTKRDTPARYENHGDLNIPYMRIQVPEGLVHTIEFRVISHSRMWDGSAVAFRGPAEISPTCFEIGTIHPDGSIHQRHLLGHFVDGEPGWTNREVKWDLDTAPEDALQWMLQLTPGTIIGVFPRAKGLGWVNFVNHMYLGLCFT